MCVQGVRMMVGCGYCEKTIRGRRYLYFWHYESRGGGRRQVEEYLGPARDPRAREAVAQRISEYVGRAQAEMAKFRETTARELARSR
ncbi:MAG: hypothetical protein ACT4OI_10595 [Methanobacteriota archaeon]